MKYSRYDKKTKAERRSAGEKHQISCRPSESGLFIRVDQKVGRGKSGSRLEQRRGRQCQFKRQGYHKEECIYLFQPDICSSGSTGVSFRFFSGSDFSSSDPAEYNCGNRPGNPSQKCPGKDEHAERAQNRCGQGGKNPFYRFHPSGAG